MFMPPVPGWGEAQFLDLERRFGPCMTDENELKGKAMHDATKYPVTCRFNRKWIEENLIKAPGMRRLLAEMDKLPKGHKRYGYHKLSELLANSPRMLALLDSAHDAYYALPNEMLFDPYSVSAEVRQFLSGLEPIEGD